MAEFHPCRACFIIIIFFQVIYFHCGALDEDRKVHIVYMGSLPKETEYSPASHHISLLDEVIKEGVGTDQLIRSYTRSFNGFAAKLTDREAQKLRSMDGVLSVFLDSTFEFHTTRSWDFMGFAESVERNRAVESDIIIGLLDTGIWPESESFDDTGFGPPPKKWKGACKGGESFTCNNKIIGARVYLSSVSSATARDTTGHGTHTAAIAAGNHVKDVSFYGLAEGTTRGAVPSARIAVYTVCPGGFECSGANILAGFDDAAADGVDIISISMGTKTADSIDNDIIAIGSFHALQKNVLTSHSAGNAGPKLETTASIAPWILTVAASSTDRRIIDKLVLGNNKTIIGNSINAFDSMQMTPLEIGEELTCAGFGGQGSAKGKILLCDKPSGDVGAFIAGASGAVTQNIIWSSSITPFPASAMVPQNYNEVEEYLDATENPQGKILRSEMMTDKNAPLVTIFSSRGPNKIIPDILKPDIIAPGNEILAAFSPEAPLTTVESDKRSVKYSILSGTSMACPHATGAAAYVKSLHPDWSPSAIKSALMTSARTMNSRKNTDQEFGYGSGHIDPVKAANPGLVYNASVEDYVALLCSIGYDGEKLKDIAGNASCPGTDGERGSPRDLNYPSMAVKVDAGKPFQIRINRTVTNVSAAKSTYKAELGKDSKLDISVTPNTLTFKKLNDKLTFTVTIKGSVPAQAVESTALVWSNGKSRVRSPIIVYVNAQ